MAAAAINTQATGNTRRWVEVLDQSLASWERTGETIAFYGFNDEPDFEMDPGKVAGVHTAEQGLWRMLGGFTPGISKPIGPERPGARDTA